MLGRITILYLLNVYWIAQFYNAQTTSYSGLLSISQPEIIIPFRDGGQIFLALLKIVSGES